MNKFVTSLKTSVAFFLAFAVSCLLFAGSALALGNFSQTCYDTSVNGSRLTSTCYKADGYTPNTSSINLDRTIGNIDGILKWGDHDFSMTCRRMDVYENMLTAQCKTRDQRWNSTKIDLDDHIANIDGTLQYE